MIDRKKYLRGALILFSINKTKLLGILAGGIFLLPLFSDAAGLVPCGGCATELDPVTGECPVGQVQPACTVCHLFELGNRIITFFLVPSSFNAGFAFVFLLGGLLLVVAGFFILVGGLGSPSLFSRGKTILFTTLIGLLIIYGSWVAINFALDFFGISDFTGTGNWWEIQCGVQPSLSMSASPSTVLAGESTTIFWDALGVTECTASGQWSGSKPSGNESELVTPPSTLGTYTYNLSCTGLGGSVTASVVVTVSHNAPVVGAGPDQVATLPLAGSVTATMAGTATDDNLPNPPGSLTIAWTQTSGPVGGATINTPSSLTTTISFSQVGTYEFQLSANDSEKQSADTVVITMLPAPPTLLAHWDFNDLNSQDDILDKISTNDGIYDPGTEGWHGGTVFGATWGAGSPGMGQAFDFDGVDDYVSIDSSAITVNDFTVTTWANINSFNVVGCCDALVEKVSAAGLNDFFIGFDATLDVFFVEFEDDDIYEGDVDPQKYVIGAAAPYLGAWHHYAYAYNSSSQTISVYVDGVLQATFPGVGAFTNDPGNILIGADVDTTFPTPDSDFINGTIDEVRIYNVPLSASQITEDMNSLYPVERPVASWSFENSTFAYDTHHIVRGASGGAGDFDGVDDYVDAGAPSVFDFGDGTTDKPFTITAWIKRGATGSTDVIVSKYRSNVTPRRQQYIFQINSSSELGFGLFDTSGDYRKWITTTATIIDSSWHHVAAVYDGTAAATGALNSMDLYIDGALQTVTVSFDNASYVAMEPTTESLKIGRYTDVLGGWQPFAGSIDEVKIWSVALTLQQVQAEFTAGP